MPCLRSHSLEITGPQVAHLGPCLALATSCLLWNHPSLSPFQVQLPEIEECRHTDPEALAGPPL